MYDSTLKDRMKAIGYTQREAAWDLGVTEATMRNKLTGRTEFRRGELTLLEMLVSEKEKQVKSINNARGSNSSKIRAIPRSAIIVTHLTPSGSVRLSNRNRRLGSTLREWVLILSKNTKTLVSVV